MVLLHGTSIPGVILMCEASTSFENFLPFLSNLKLLSANSFSLEESKICCLGKDYKTLLFKKELGA